MLYLFPETLVRAEINPAKMDMKNFEEQILQDIENAAQRAAANRERLHRLAADGSAGPDRPPARVLVP